MQAAAVVAAVLAAVEPLAVGTLRPAGWLPGRAACGGDRCGARRGAARRGGERGWAGRCSLAVFASPLAGNLLAPPGLPAPSGERAAS
jgi:hypothetical protein